MTEERAPLPQALTAPPSGRVLAFVPHADDDVIGIGGALALHADAGDPVRVVVIYDGLEGDPDRRHDPVELARRRRAEAVAGGAHLGVSDYAFWGYPEGHEPPLAVLAEGADRVADEVRSFGPDVVYAPWPGEHHVDHHVAARVVRMGLWRAGYTGLALGFEVWTPLVATWVLDVTPVYDRKVAALEEHESQLEYHDVVHKTLGLHAQRSLYLSSGARYGEAFRLLGPLSDEERRFLEERA